MIMRSPKTLHRFANPARFMRLSSRALPWCLVMSFAFLLAGLYLGLFVAPPDYQQGESARIMFVHVPAAWLALLIYGVMAVASATALVWRHPLADLIAKSCAPIGAAFTIVALVTGSLWGKPMWGTWWVWDARLTSVLILLFLYLGYMALWQALENRETASKAAAILAIIGVINLPIIKFSVDWWNTLHQPSSVVKLSGSTIHSSMLWPLLIMAAGFLMFFFVVLILKVQREIIASKVRANQYLSSTHSHESSPPADRDE